jgi:two-component system phosphate regulon response regulator PhoB
MTTNKVLVVEDDSALANVLQYNLKQAGYQVQIASDGHAGLAEAREYLPAVIVLDLMIPGIDGLEVCRRLRADESTRQIPILMLTARGAEDDQLKGFAAGADDYVTKPFSVKVLLQRVEAVQRRKPRDDGAGDIVSLNGITVDRLRHRVLLDQVPLNLTPSEFRLIDTLIRQPGRAFDRNELIDAVLGGDALILERTIDVHVRALRKKLHGRASMIETVRGVGYRFQSP